MGMLVPGRNDHLAAENVDLLDAGGRHFQAELGAKIDSVHLWSAYSEAFG